MVKFGTIKYAGRIVQLITLQKSNETAGFAAVLMPPYLKEVRDADSGEIARQKKTSSSQRILSTSENGWTEKRFGLCVDGPIYQGYPLRFKDKRQKGLFHANVFRRYEIPYEDYVAYRDYVLEACEAYQLKRIADEIQKDPTLKRYEHSPLQAQRFSIIVNLESRLEQIGRFTEEKNERAARIGEPYKQELNSDPLSPFSIFDRCLRFRGIRNAVCHTFYVIEQAIRSLPNFDDPKSVRDYMEYLKKQSSIFSQHELNSAIKELETAEKTAAEIPREPHVTQDIRLSKIMAAVGPNNTYINRVLEYHIALLNLKYAHEKKLFEQPIQDFINRIHLVRETYCVIPKKPARRKYLVK